MFAGDLGFRVFKLDSSNIRAWEPNRDDLPRHFRLHRPPEDDRTEQDILFELLLKLGLDLTVPIERRTIAGKDVHNIGGGTLLVCLAEQIAAAEVEPLALGLPPGTRSWLLPARPRCLPRQRLCRRRGQDQPHRHSPAARAGEHSEPVR